jgi:hypothetical protein
VREDGGDECQEGERLLNSKVNFLTQPPSTIKSDLKLEHHVTPAVPAHSLSSADLQVSQIRHAAFQRVHRNNARVRL